MPQRSARATELRSRMNRGFSSRLPKARTFSSSTSTDSANAKEGASMNDAARLQVINLLRGGQAHAAMDDALKNFPAKLRGVKPKGAPHTAWQLLEHLRIAQWDI